jgi:hypothetical protein
VRIGGSFAFGATYLLLIPIFALVYQKFPTEFYHGNIRFEQSFAADQHALNHYLSVEYGRHLDQLLRASGAGDMICREVLPPKKEAKNVHPYGTFELIAHKFAPEWNEPEMGDLDVPAMMVLSCDDHHGSQMAVPLCAVLSAQLVTFDGKNNGQPAAILRQRPCAHEKQWYKLLAKGPGQALFAFEDKLFLQREVYEISREWMYSLASAQQGFPTTTSFHNFNRMLYFSAMTITTVGFGDIVPISDRTRLLTAAEAVSGIIVIGLFLNSLAQQIAKKDR